VSIHLITPDRADELVERAPGTPGSPDRAAYLADFLRLGPPALTGSRDLERLVLALGEKLIPLVVNDGREEDCYLLSPYAHYVKYMLIELRKMQGNRAARALIPTLAILGRLGRWLGFNQCVSVNNWLFTTNPALALSAEELRTLTSLLVQRYRHSALVIRSVDGRDPAVRRTFEEAGYRLVVNRPVHEWSGAGLTRSQRRTIRRDLELLRDDRFTVIPDARLGPGDERTIEELYTQLYVRKHLGFNARYTARFFRSVHDSRLMTFLTFRLRDRIAGFVSHFDDADRTVAALVGYDTGLDRKSHPLYRMAVASMFQLCSARRRLLFLSTGAASFKAARGSYEWLEYEAVYDRHLPPPRRLPWACFGALLDATVGKLETDRL
jgi:hypothetical protein